MILVLLSLLSAIPLLFALFLIRNWELQQEGVDLETQGIDLRRLAHFSKRQKITLLLLLVPVALFLMFCVLYAIASLVTVAVGV